MTPSVKVTSNYSMPGGGDDRVYIVQPEHLLCCLFGGGCGGGGMVRILIFCLASETAYWQVGDPVYSLCTVAGNVLHNTYSLKYRIPSSKPRQKRVGWSLYVHCLMGSGYPRGFIPGEMIQPCLAEGLAGGNLILCSASISLLSSLLGGRRPTACADITECSPPYLFIEI